MQSQLIAVVLCVFANAASAQCTASTVAPVAAATTGGIVKVSHVTTSAAPARTGGQLINTAAAGTRDEPLMLRDPSSVVRPAARNNDGDEHKHRNGTAMLLAALALMSGIVLRRSSHNA